MEPGAAGVVGALAVDRARSAADLQAALKTWKMPVVEVVYADADGQVGRQVAGLVPIRQSWDGAMPAPGWTGTFEWRGWRTLDDLPHSAARDVDQRVPIAANQNPARTSRLQEIFGGARTFTIADVQAAQHDVTSWNAGQLVPLLERLPSGRDAVDAARRQLLQWDRRVSAGSPAASLYVNWEEALLRKLAERRVPPALIDSYLLRARLDVTALTRPSRAWFDRDREKARDALLLEALAAAVDRVG